MGAHPHSHNPHAGQGPVVIDIGGDVGALILRTPAAMSGAEIEISPLGADDRRSHVAVLPRQVGPEVVHAAVYPALREGIWNLWSPDGPAVLQVSITGGSVTETRWPQTPAT